MTEEFDPDWTVAPAAYLEEWMSDNHATLGVVARKATGGLGQLGAGLLIREVLQRKTLTAVHAELLERATGISARMWLALEQQYRRDMAAGRTDFDDTKDKSDDALD